MVFFIGIDLSIGALIHWLNPENIWLRHSDGNKNLKDTTLNYPCELPKEIQLGKVKTMLWKGDTNTKYYNIWIIPFDEEMVSISFTMSD